jgi:hypothetical protein
MTNNSVLDTLRERWQEIGEEQQQASALVAQCHEELAYRRASAQAERAADGAAMSQQQGLREAEARLAGAEQNFTLIQKSWQEITEDIQRVQQGV